MTTFTECLRVLSERIVREHFADETPLFEHVWGAFLNRLGSERIEDIENSPLWTGSGPVQPLGAIGDAGGQALDSMFVIGSLIGAAITLLRDGQNSLIDTAQVRNALQSEAARMEAPRRVRDVLEKYATGLLAEQFEVVVDTREGEQEVGSFGAARDGASSPRSDQVFIDRMVDGHRRKCGWHNMRVRRENRRNPNYDIVVDGIAREVLVREDRINAPDAPLKTVFIPTIEPRAAGMLWLALQKFGGDVTYGDIRKHFGLMDSQKSAVPQAKNALKSLLGSTLLGRLIGDGSDGRYPITSDSVNYCWIRRDKSPSTSGLRYRTGSPRE